jgi:hypothetical protein
VASETHSETALPETPKINHEGLQAQNQKIETQETATAESPDTEHQESRAQNASPQQEVAEADNRLPSSGRDNGDTVQEHQLVSPAIQVGGVKGVDAESSSVSQVGVPVVETPVKAHQVVARSQSGGIASPRPAAETLSGHKDLNTSDEKKSSTTNEAALVVSVQTAALPELTTTKKDLNQTISSSPFAKPDQVTSPTETPRVDIKSVDPSMTIFDALHATGKEKITPDIELENVTLKIDLDSSDLNNDDRITMNGSVVGGGVEDHIVTEDHKNQANSTLESTVNTTPTKVTDIHVTIADSLAVTSETVTSSSRSITIDHESTSTTSPMTSSEERETQQQSVAVLEHIGECYRKLFIEVYSSKWQGASE